jgi:CheY-like chemotaxis protein
MILLVVEDNEDDIFILKRVLDKLAFKSPVNVAVDGREAINYLSSSSNSTASGTFPVPDLILLDLNCPLFTDLKSSNGSKRSLI